MSHSSQLESSEIVTSQPIDNVKPLSSGQSGTETRTIPAGEFKAKCLKLLDEVAESREPLIITKFGKPVARLVPMENRYEGLRGSMRGTVLWVGDIISPLDVEWDAVK